MFRKSRQCGPYTFNKPPGDGFKKYQGQNSHEYGTQRTWIYRGGSYIDPPREVGEIEEQQQGCQNSQVFLLNTQQR